MGIFEARRAAAAAACSHVSRTRLTLLLSSSSSSDTAARARLCTDLPFIRGIRDHKGYNIRPAAGLASKNSRITFGDRDRPSLGNYRAIGRPAACSRWYSLFLPSLPTTRDSQADLSLPRRLTASAPRDASLHSTRWPNVPEEAAWRTARSLAASFRRRGGSISTLPSCPSRRTGPRRNAVASESFESLSETRTARVTWRTNERRFNGAGIYLSIYLSRLRVTLRAANNLASERGRKAISRSPYLGILQLSRRHNLSARGEREN